MRRKAPHPVIKKTLNLYTGDFETMGELHPNIGASCAIRELIRSHIKSIMEGSGRAPAQTLQLEVPFDE